MSPVYVAGRELRQRLLGKPEGPAGPTPEWGWARYEPPPRRVPEWLPRSLPDPAVRVTCGGAPW